MKQRGKSLQTHKADHLQGSETDTFKETFKDIPIGPSRIMTPAYLDQCHRPEVVTAAVRLRHLRAIGADPAEIERAANRLSRRVALAPR